MIFFFLRHSHVMQQVKDPVLPPQWLGSLLWPAFTPWPRNFHIPWAWQKKIFLNWSLKNYSTKSYNKKRSYTTEITGLEAGVHHLGGSLSMVVFLEGWLGSRAAQKLVTECGARARVCVYVSWQQHLSVLLHPILCWCTTPSKSCRALEINYSPI